MMPQQMTPGPPSLTACMSRGGRENVFLTLRHVALGSSWLVLSPNVTKESPEPNHAGALTGPSRPWPPLTM
jgi:hypothetical protein